MQYGAETNTQALAGVMRSGTSTTDYDRVRAEMYNYFGAPPGGRQLTNMSYGQPFQSSTSLLQAYEGPNRLIADTFDGLVASDRRNPVTTTIMPVMQTSEIRAEMRKFIFSKTLPGLTPHEAPSRVITSRETRKMFEAQRYGLAFMMEGDFSSTAKADLQYTRNYITILQAVDASITLTAEEAMLNSQHFSSEWASRYSSADETAYRRMISDEAANFAAAALGNGRLDYIIAQHRTVLSNRGFVPDFVLLWPNARLFMQKVMTPTITRYWELGPTNQPTYERGADALGTLGEIAVFETRDHDVSETGPKWQSLVRDVMVGEAYHMFWDRRTEDLRANKVGYQTSQRDIKVYSLPLDNYVRISFAEALMASGIFDDEGELHSWFGDYVDMYSSNKIQQNHKEYVDKVNLYNSSASITGNNSKALPMFVAHSTESSLVVARRLGDMDITAVSNFDLLQTAMSMIQNDGEILEPSPLLTASSISPTIKGNPMMMFGSDWSHEQMNVILYGSVDEKSETLLPPTNPSSTKLSKWFANRANECSASGDANSPAFDKARVAYQSMGYKLLDAWSKATKTQASKVRELLFNAIQGSLDDNGEFRAGQTIETVLAEIESVSTRAARMKPANRVESEILAKYVDATMLHPQVTEEALRTGSPLPHFITPDEADYLSNAHEAYLKAKTAMQRRILFHGEVAPNGTKFSDDTAEAWLEAVRQSASADVAEETTKAVKSFIDARNALKANMQTVFNSNVSAIQSVTSGADIAVYEVSSGKHSKRSFSQSVENIKLRTKFANTLNDPKVRNAFMLAVAIPITKPSLSAMAQRNYHIPFNVLLIRPWIQLRMFTGIIGRSGIGMGFNMVGNSNFVFGYSASTKVILGHLTYYYQPVVYEERALMLMRNIAPCDYLGGWNERIITKGVDYEQEPHEVLNAGPAAQLSRASLLACVIPITESRLVYPISIVSVAQGPPKTSGRNNALSAHRNAAIGTFSMAAFYAKVFNVPDSSATRFVNDTYADEHSAINTVVHLGAHFSYNPATNDYTEFSHGDGHLSGPRTGSGTASVWRGQQQEFPFQSKAIYT